MDEASWNDPFFAAANAAPAGAGGPGRIRMVAVDLDGVVWLGGTMLPDAAPALNEVVRRGLDLRYVSNNSTAHREAVSERLAAAGLPAGVDRVLDLRLRDRPVAAAAAAAGRAGAGGG